MQSVCMCACAFNWLDCAANATVIEIEIVIEIHSSYPDRDNEIFGDSLNRCAVYISFLKGNWGENEEIEFEFIEMLTFPQMSHSNG